MTGGTENGQEVAKIANPKLTQIEHIFVTMKPDLEGDQFWRYQRVVSPGLQEYIEALSYTHYLTHDSLITWEQVQHRLSDESGSPVRSPFFLFRTLCVRNPTSIVRHFSSRDSELTINAFSELNIYSIFLCRLKTICLAYQTSRES